MRAYRTAVLLLLPLTMTACGQATRSKPTSKATPVNVETVTPTVFPAPTTAAPSTSGSAEPTATATSAKPNTVHAVSGTFKFDPTPLTVKAGTTVTWTSDGSHSATGGTSPNHDAASPIDAPIGFTTYHVKFTKAGTYKYFCIPHASLGMVGEIVVT